MSFRTTCLICASPSLAEVIDLGMHPFADTFIPKERLSEPDLLYPLVVDRCETCGGIQTRTVTDPLSRYMDTEYSYTSSNSATSRAHWSDYAEAMRAHLPQYDGSVIEIGSNDGYLCEKFVEQGRWVLGVDPSPSMAMLAEVRGVKTHQSCFGLETADAILDRRGKANLLIANNVLNHANDPLDFAQGVKALLHAEGTFVFELPYWLRTLTQGTYDQIYHEHVTYWTMAGAVNLFAKVGMSVVDAEEVDYHGGSIRVYVKHEGVPSSRVGRMVLEEVRAGLYKPETYERFRRRIANQKQDFLHILYDLQPLVFCIGAAAKGNTFLNYHRLDAERIAGVTDSSPQKIGKWTPGTRIPICPDYVLEGLTRPYAILTAWNLAETLTPKLRALNPNIQVLTP